MSKGHGLIHKREFHYLLTIDEALCNKFAFSINILNFLRSYVFTLCQLEDILLPVQDDNSQIILPWKTSKHRKIDVLISKVGKINVENDATTS